jgi:hypothetical protein
MSISKERFAHLRAQQLCSGQNQIYSKTSTVKWGNVVTFFAQNHIFLRIFFR